MEAVSYLRLSMAQKYIIHWEITGEMQPMTRIPKPLVLACARAHTHTHTHTHTAVKGIVRVFFLDKEEKQRENVRQIC